MSDEPRPMQSMVVWQWFGLKPTGTSPVAPPSALHWVEFVCNLDGPAGKVVDTILECGPMSTSATPRVFERQSKMLVKVGTNYIGPAQDYAKPAPPGSVGVYAEIERGS
jgi:hypothetical protein